MLKAVRSYVIFMVGLVLGGCGGGGGTDGATAPLENRVDVAVAGLPVGVPAAITITDPSGKTVGSLTAPGQTVVTGPGTFNVSADPVVAGATTYVATVVPTTFDVPAPPSITMVRVTYTLAPPLRLQFEAVASGLVSPTFLASPPGGTDIYIVEQPGRIRKLVNGVPQAPVLDVSARVSYAGERGMLSLAFDPQFATNGNVFVYFTEANGDLAIERFTFPVTGALLEPSRRRCGFSPSPIERLQITTEGNCSSASMACFTSGRVMAAGAAIHSEADRISTRFWARSFVST